MATLTATVTNAIREPESGAWAYILELNHPKAEAVPTPSSIEAGVACQSYGVFVIPSTAISSAIIVKAKLNGVMYATDTDNFGGVGAGDTINFEEEV